MLRAWCLDLQRACLVAAIGASCEMVIQLSSTSHYTLLQCGTVIGPHEQLAFYHVSAEDSRIPEPHEYMAWHMSSHKIINKTIYNTNRHTYQ